MYLVTWIGLLIALVPSTISVFRFERYGNSVKIRLSIVIWANCIIELVSALLFISGVKNNMPLYHVYIGMEFFLVTYLFSAILPNVLTPARQLTLSGAFVAALLLKLLDWESIFEFPSVLRPVESGVLIGLSVLYFLSVMKSEEFINLFKSANFWISSAMLIYFSANMLIFAYTDYLAEQSMELFSAVWYIHTGLNVIFYSLLTVALLCRTPTAKY
ncbi:hypothetical protein [Phaeocystidibacter luteus]|uniref:Uncharacterized protein n=1 Tax=Phaeocystidibacter luteus TaxID=911197 RepID=A0A6N6RI43_9FLAO|nr:hypothetical protein [Phaeocystidibacter luteus]KAB2810109.1 hypothetical protein F8C67_07690 [Phaeocystidibacter luteus]